MHNFLLVTGTIAIAEIGDKTQLLALLLAARYRQPLPLIAGITLATLANHAIAAVLGGGLAAVLPPQTLRLLLAASFAAMALWTLREDRYDGPVQGATGRGAFMAAAIAFFIAEIGDKTQLATAALAAQTGALALVVAGSTLGMLIANVPAVLFGERLLRLVPARAMRRAAAALFATIAVWVGLDL